MCLLKLRNITMEEDFWTPHGQQGLAEGSVSFMFLSFWAVHFVTRNKNYLQLVFSQKKKNQHGESSIPIVKEKCDICFY